MQCLLILFGIGLAGSLLGEIPRTITIPDSPYTAYDIPEGGSDLVLYIVPGNDYAIDASDIYMQDESDTVQWYPEGGNTYRIGTVFSSREYLWVTGLYHKVTSSGGPGPHPKFDAKVNAVDVDIAGAPVEATEETVGVWLGKGGARKAVSISAVKCKGPNNNQVLSWSSAKLSLWPAALGGNSLPGGSKSLTANYTTNFYVQGDMASSSIRDSEVAMSYSDSISGESSHDRVKLTVVGGTITPFSQVLVNGTNDVSVTLSPNPPGITNTLEIVCLNGDGSAQFVPSGSTSSNIAQSATVKIKGLTASSVSNNMMLKIVMGADVLASNVFTVVEPVVEMNQTENPETICDDNTFSAVVQPSGLSVSLYRFESRQASGGNWSTITNVSSSPISFTPRIPGHFKRRVIAVINGTEYTSSEIDVETRFPDNTTIAGSSIVEAQRSTDWTAASGASGDHNERGGWIYLDTQTCTYRVDPWPVGDFFGVNPSGNPADSGSEYFVGEYHLHATLRDTNDIANATNFPTGPSQEDIGASTASDTPGLLRDRHADEIVETGHTDYFYGPTRRTTLP